MRIARTLDEQSNAAAQMARREAQPRSKIREAITDNFHEVCGFRTDYQYITKSKMRIIQKKVMVTVLKGLIMIFTMIMRSRFLMCLTRSRNM